jgi:hypothetical protein
MVGGGCGNQSLGYGTTISGGVGNTTASYYSFQTIAGGFKNIADGFAVVGGGCCNIASASSTISGGYCNKTTSIGNTIGGGASNVICGNTNYLATIGGGGQNLICCNAQYSFIGGGSGNLICNNACYVGIAFGNSNRVLNGSYASVLGGHCNFATGSFSGVVAGQSNCATGCYSSNLGGYTNTASGYVSTALGGWGNCATGCFSSTIGINACSYLYAQNAVSSGQFSATGDAQSATLVVRRSAGALITGATFDLSLDGTGTTNLVIPATSTSWAIKVQYVARVVGVTGSVGAIVLGDSKTQTQEVGVRNVAGTLSILTGSPNSGIAIEDPSMNTAGMSYSVSGGNALAMTFAAPIYAGGGALTIKVVATLTITEVK